MVYNLYFPLFSFLLCFVMILLRLPLAQFSAIYHPLSNALLSSFSSLDYFFTLPPFYISRILNLIRAMNYPFSSMFLSNLSLIIYHTRDDDLLAS